MIFKKMIANDFCSLKIFTMNKNHLLQNNAGMKICPSSQDTTKFDLK